MEHSPLLWHLVNTHDSSSDVSHHRQLIGEIFQTISSIMPRIAALTCSNGDDATGMSDTIVIQAVYIAISPFFVEGSDGDAKGTSKKSSTGATTRIIPSTLGTSPMRGLRLEALSLIRSVS